MKGKHMKYKVQVNLPHSGWSDTGNLKKENNVFPIKAEAELTASRLHLKSSLGLSYRVVPIRKAKSKRK